MQIIEFKSPVINVLFVAAFWAALQIAIPLILIRINDRYFNSASFFFKTHSWEKNGEIYEKIFKIKKWKKMLPDGGKVMKGGFQKKHIDTSSTEMLEKYVVESCRGEFVHWLLILPFWVAGYFAPPVVIPVMMLYSLVANLPCIIAQRYNRPRVIKLIEKMKNRTKISIE